MKTINILAEIKTGFEFEERKKSVTIVHKFFVKLAAAIQKQKRKNKPNKPKTISHEFMHVRAFDNRSIHQSHQCIQLVNSIGEVIE